MPSYNRHLCISANPPSLTRYERFPASALMNGALDVLTEIRLRVSFLAFSSSRPLRSTYVSMGFCACIRAIR